MKSYLVAYKKGINVVDSAIVQTPDDYVPGSDNMRLLKRLVVRHAHPRSYEALVSSTNDNPTATENAFIGAEKLQIIAVSNLEV